MIAMTLKMENISLFIEINHLIDRNILSRNPSLIRSDNDPYYF